MIGAVAMLLADTATFDVPGMLAIQGVCVVSGLAVLAAGERTPAWLLRVAPYGGVALSSVALLLTDSSTSPYALFYLWVAFYAYAFVSRAEAAVLGLFTSANYIAVSVIIGDAQPSAIVLLVGTLAVAGSFIVLLRERVVRLFDQLSDAARTDPLTGLANRRAFHDVVAHEFERCRRHARPFSLLLADCDHFKRLNDRLGHQAGDAALQTIARLLETHKRTIDVAARMGGEEFALVLPETDENEAFVVAERLRSELRRAFADAREPLTMSFGVAAFPVNAADGEELLRCADEALYAAKALGRDRTVRHSAQIAGVFNGEDDERQAGAQLETVLTLAEALDIRDTGTARHSQTVSRLCEGMARELGFAREHVERLRLAGMLHDIGKIGVPDAVLRKPGPLNDDEWRQMRGHPGLGARILGGTGLQDVRAWVLAHHERPDGGGYPTGLMGDEIPLEARILAVADAYEAMISDRVYRRALGPEVALAELRAGAGTQFDPDVVAAFERTRRRAGAPA